MRIPEFTRTVLPDRAVGSAAIEVARAPYERKAEAFGQARQAVRQVENVAGDYAHREAQAKNATAVNEGVLSFKKESADLESSMRQARAGSPEGFHKDFDSELQKLSDKYVDSMPSDAAKNTLRGTLNLQRANAYESNLGWERVRKTENYAESVGKSQKIASDIAAQRAIDGKSIDDLLSDMDATAVAGSTIVEGAEKVEKIRLAGRRRVIDSAINSAIQYNPNYAMELIEKYGAAGKGGFDNAIKTVMQNEGGFVAVDGASEAPAIYGINEKWHPEAFAEAKKITDEKGQKAGQEYAQAFYKKEFWDKNNIGALPKEAQTIVFDGVVNHASDFSKKLIEAAKGGASPGELINMREEEYRRLARANPEKYGKSLPGWLNRLESMKPEFSMTPEDMTKYEKEAKASILKFDENKQIDQLVEAARSQWDLYNSFAEGEMTLTKISDLEKGGRIEKKFADYMRKSIIKANPISAEEQNQVYSDMFDEVMQLDIKVKNGKIKIGKDGVTLEDLSRLQTKLIKESVRGVTGLKPLMNKVSPALLAKADDERGTDDRGIDSFFGFFRKTETYDSGYQIIQDFLEKQGKENDLALKSSMLSSFVEQADTIPEETLKNPRALEIELSSIANNVIAKSFQGGSVKNIPVAAIAKLLNNPSTAPQFDEIFGVGAADRVLGK